MEKLEPLTKPESKTSQLAIYYSHKLIIAINFTVLSSNISITDEIIFLFTI